MDYRLYQNLQNSLVDKLQAQITSDGLTGDNSQSISVRASRKNDDNWALPAISVYFESETATRFELGSNKRDDRQLIIIDIYATNENERLSLAKWLVDTINDGWQYYTYAYNSVNPESPTKTAGGWVNVNFLTNEPVNLVQTVSEIDAHRHRVSISVWIS